MPQFGDRVVLILNDKKHNALVIGERHLEHHKGSADEPMLHLVIVDRLKDAFGKFAPFNVGGIHDVELVKFHYDVPHLSQEFTDAQKEAIQKGGVTFDAVYPGGKIAGGRWIEAESVADPEKKEESVIDDKPKTNSSSSVQ